MTADPPSNLHLRLSVPTVFARLSVEQVASTICRLIASDAANTQAELVHVTGLARTTVVTAVSQLQRAGLLHTLGSRPTTGRGRPAELLGLRPNYGLILVADVGMHFARLSVHDLSQQLLKSTGQSLDVEDGPEAALATVTEAFSSMLAELDERGFEPRPEPVVLVIGLPGPMDTTRGIPVKPPIMPGWDGYPVADTLRAAFHCPVLVENDVNLRALGEARALARDQSPLLYIKVSTGIGGGLVTATGDLYHGADGSAGDIGHVRVPDADDILCRCGNYGCIEAVASIPAILRQLQERGSDGGKVPTTRDELNMALRTNDREAVALIREAAARVGEVVASLVHFYNPSRIVVGGGLTVSTDDLLAGIRAVVYRRALPLATRNLVISQPALGEWSATGGGLVLGVEYSLTVEAMRLALSKSSTTKKV